MLILLFLCRAVNEQSLNAQIDRIAEISWMVFFLGAFICKSLHVLQFCHGGRQMLTESFYVMRCSFS